VGTAGHQHGQDIANPGRAQSDGGRGGVQVRKRSSGALDLAGSEQRTHVPKSVPMHRDGRLDTSVRP
jgi:hypothetical protein